MKTVLVPIDFSDTSINAAKYAVLLCKQIKAERIVLFHTYGGSYQILDNGPEVVVATTQALLEQLRKDLDQVKSELGTEADSSLVFAEELTAGFLLEDALSIIEQYQVDLVVMGITGRNTLEQRLIGSNTYRMAMEAPCPVLIVPSKANFESIEKVALSIKFKAGVLEETPHEEIKTFVEALGAKLTVMNVADDNVRQVMSEVQSGLIASHLMFDEENAEVVFLGDEQHDTVKSLTDYVHENNIQMMISITHKMGFLKSLFKGSITKQLAFYTDIPLMVYRAK